jgi:hypothetical protein
MLATGLSVEHANENVTASVYVTRLAPVSLVPAVLLVALLGMLSAAPSPPPGYKGGVGGVCTRNTGGGRRFSTVTDVVAISEAAKSGSLAAMARKVVVPTLST